MYPLKFNPILKQTLWGGEKIISLKHLCCGLHQVGESWEVSGVRGNESVVAEGEYAGRTLTDLVETFKEKLVGTANYARFGNTFPLLIKFIDAREDLSIQVHPSDELARKRHDSAGKTEMWYVVDAEQNAKLRVGFSHKITSDEYEQRVEQSTITDVLREYDIHSGDVFFLPAGRIHSIGAGAFIAEIQQTSDITYRIFDFNRKDANGRTRELHTELAKDAINYEVLDDYRTHYEPVENRPAELVTCPYFTTSLYRLTENMACDYSELDSFVILICVEGEGCRITDNEGHETGLRPGESLLLPATVQKIDIVPAGNGVKLLETYV